MRNPVLHRVDLLDLFEISEGWCLQEFNLEKLQLIEVEKANIRKEFERKENQAEVQKKM